MSRAAAPRREYDSPVRRQQRAKTLENIVAAGAKLMRGLPEWDLEKITAVSVSVLAGVSERTVQRYFPTERVLRDAVLQRLISEAGFAWEDGTVHQFVEVITRLFGSRKLRDLSNKLPSDLRREDVVSILRLIKNLYSDVNTSQ